MDILANVFWSGLFVFLLLGVYLQIDGTKYKDADNFTRLIGVLSFYPALICGVLWVFIFIWS